MNEQIDYVPFNIAKALLNRNFRYLCDSSYSPTGEFLPHKQSNNSDSSHKIACPSFYQVKEWLRQEKCIHIEISPFTYNNEVVWGYYVYTFSLDPYELSCIYESFEESNDRFNTYEDALNDALEYAIDDLL